MRSQYVLLSFKQACRGRGRAKAKAKAKATSADDALHHSTTVNHL